RRPPAPEGHRAHSRAPDHLSDTSTTYITRGGSRHRRCTMVADPKGSVTLLFHFSPSRTVRLCAGTRRNPPSRSFRTVVLQDTARNTHWPPTNSGHATVATSSRWTWWRPWTVR